MKSIILLMVAYAAAAPQDGPAVILDMRIEDRVVYFYDSPDYSKLAADPSSTKQNARTFSQFVSIADIVSINGKPVKGVWTIRATTLNLSPNPKPAEGIADVVRANQADGVFEILQPDGTPIGTIATLGLSAGSAPPGAPLIAANTNFAVIGGTGAFLGVRGQQELVEVVKVEHLASVTEDPANRRMNGAAAGIRRVVLHLIPMERPQVVSTSSGPAIVHSSNFRPVSTANPAHAGENLTLFAAGLGPLRTVIDPGMPFPFSPIAAANSPVDVMVNGSPGLVSYAGGYPGAVNGYQVNFVVPPDAAPGLGALQLSAAWVTGAQVPLPIR
jgi:hypothetical protein